MQSGKNTQPLLSQYKALQQDTENFDKKSRASRNSEMSHLSESQRINRFEEYKRAVNKSEDTFYQWMTCAKYVNVIAALYSIIFMTWMSALVWSPLIYICVVYEKGDADTLQQIKFKNQCKIYFYLCLAIVQIIWISTYVFSDFLGTVFVNGVQIFILWGIKSKLQEPVDKDQFLKNYRGDPMNKLVAGAAVDFFNKELIKQINSSKSQTDKAEKDMIIKKFQEENGSNQK